MPSSWGSCQSRDPILVSCIGRRFFTTSATWEAQEGLQEIVNEVWKERGRHHIGGWIEGSLHYTLYNIISYINMKTENINN